MGGPAAIVYIPRELSKEEFGDCTQLFEDKSWRTSPDNHDVLDIVIEGMEYEHDAGDIVALETALGWRPMQQIQVISHGNSDARWHVDVALGAARLARKFDGRIQVFAREEHYGQISHPSVPIHHPEYGTYLERIVDAAWLDQFVELDAPRFRK